MKRITMLVALLVAGTMHLAAQDLTNVDFTLRDIDGKDQSFQKLLKEVRGDEATPRKGAIIISFWAMWCTPCKAEMKALVGMYEKWAPKNLRYIAINTDNPRSLAKVKSYITAQGLPYLHWLDPNQEVFKKLNGQSYPYSLIVDSEGKLIAKRAGFIAGDEKEIEEDIRKILE